MHSEIEISKCTIFADSIRRADNSLYANDKAVLTDQKNKKDVFEKIYVSNIEKITFFSLSYLGDITDAQNIAHDVFASFWKKIDSIRPECATSYLFESAKNSCLNLLRKRNNSAKYKDFSLKCKCDYLNRIALENSVSSHVYEIDVEKIIGKGMQMMKPKVRRTFVLSRFKGLKNKDIAISEGVAESTIEARITLALLIMKKLLKDYI